MVGLLLSCPFSSSLDWAKSLRIPSSNDEEKNSLCLSTHLLHRHIFYLLENFLHLQCNTRHHLLFYCLLLSLGLWCEDLFFCCCRWIWWVGCFCCSLLLLLGVSLFICCCWFWVCELLVDYGLEQAQCAVLLSFSGDLLNRVLALVEREFSTTHKVFFSCRIEEPMQQEG
jgi:hypothetical protein